MSSVLRTLGLALLATLAPALAAQGAPRPLKVGVTLHPYYSWTKNVVGDVPGVEVRAVLPGDVDAGSYQPAPEDIKKLADLDALVVNGLGHDAFIQGMLEASGNTRAVVIRPNEGTPLIRALHGGEVNSHTFLSFSNAVQQTYAIEKKLSELRPEHAAAFRKNAREYARRLRKIKSDAAAQLADAPITRAVTVHDGYSYLLQEFGLELAGVVEPAHGRVPSAEELQGLIALVKRDSLEVVFSEESFPPKLLDLLKQESGARVYVLSHVAVGPFTADKFETEMKANAATLVRALVTDAR
jgi:zinc transport system substrate-binding protein